MREPFFPALPLHLPAPSQGPGNLKDIHYPTLPESSWSSEGRACLMDKMVEALPRPWPQQKDNGYPSPKCCWGLIGIISFSSYHWGLVSPGTLVLSHTAPKDPNNYVRPGKPPADGGSQEEVACPKFQPSLAQLVKLPPSRAF